MDKTEIESAVSAIASWDDGQSRKPLDEIERAVRETHGDEGLRAVLEDALARLLESPAATLAGKGIAGRLLWRVGTDRSVPALAKLLLADDTAEMACSAIGRRPSEAADRALRDALGAAKGRALAAAINLAGERKDAGAVERLEDIARNTDKATAIAAIAALGKIASEKVLDYLFHDGFEDHPDAAVHALLRCAREMAGRGDRNMAEVIYEGLRSPFLPLAIRRGSLLGRMEGGNTAAVLKVLAGDSEPLKATALAAVPRLSAEAKKRLAEALPKLPEKERSRLAAALRE